MRRAPWDMLFADGGFSPRNFPNLFDPVWFVSLVFLVAAVVIYIVQTRRFHRHPPLLDLQEWLLWTGIGTFGMLIVCAIFKFYFVFVVVTLVVGLATFIWVRFFRFPPLIEAYNQALRRARFLSQEKYRKAEATIRPRKTSKSRRRR